MNTNLKDAAKSALRVWLFTTVGLWIPGLLGWINEVTQWAAQKGAPAFPDPSNLAYLFVAALTAAFPAAVAGIVRLLENASGHTILPRASESTVTDVQGRHERGEVSLIGAALACFLVGLLLVALFGGVLDTLGIVLLIAACVLLILAVVNRPRF